MTNDKHSSRLRDEDIRIVFWVIPIFRAIKDVDRFRTFAMEHGYVENVPLLSGFRLFLRIMFPQYLEWLRVSEFFRFTRDTTTDRAFFAGVELDKFPNSSEMANIYKNVREMFESTYHAHSFRLLAEKFDEINRRFILPLSQAFELNVIPNTALAGRFSKEDLLGFVAAGNLWYHAHDISKWVPIRDAPFGDILVERGAKYRKELDFQFPGYKLALAFVWNELLGKKSQELVAPIVKATTWEELNAVHGVAHRVAVESLQSDYGLSLGSSLFFRKQGKVNKTLFGDLITSSPEPVLSLDDRIDKALLYYQIELIDSAQSKLFSGASTFASLLRGEILQRSTFGNRERVQVIRIKHPGYPWFSYGILMERFGTIYDASGWLIFLDVGSPGGEGYIFAESMLKGLRNSINIRNFEVDEKTLRAFYIRKIKGHLGFSEEEVSETDFARFRVDDLERFRTESLGRLLEFVAKAYYEVQGFNATIYFDDAAVLPNRWEIDLLATSLARKQVIVAECSLQIPIEGIRRLISEINNKLDMVRKSSKYSEYDKFNKVIITSAEALTQLRNKKRIIAEVTKNDIEILTIENDIIPRLPKRYRRRPLLQLFQSSRRRYWPEGIYGAATVLDHPQSEE
jgi:hypothetical protein